MSDTLIPRRWLEIQRCGKASRGLTGYAGRLPKYPLEAARGRSVRGGNMGGSKPLLADFNLPAPAGTAEDYNMIKWKLRPAYFNGEPGEFDLKKHTDTGQTTTFKLIVDSEGCFETESFDPLYAMFAKTVD